MTLKLHFGVIDVPYVANEPEAKTKGRAKRGAKAKRVKASPDQTTTGDVAEILEEKYGIMEAFFENNENAIAGFLEEGLKGTVENLFTGAPATNDPFGSGTSKIEEAFKDFLSTREAERVGIEGTPTRAALRGVNHRLKHPYAKGNPRRPSFIDTGLYQTSFKAWVE